MSTEVAAPPASRTDRADPARRGRLVLADKVVEKIAGQAAAEVGAVHGRSGGVLGIGSHVDRAARPDVDVDLSGDHADLALTVGIAYPGSIRRTTHELRTHVVRRVKELTGVDVHRLDLEVAFLSVTGIDTDRPQEGLR
ncbi:Asp23/Gls24 family envelope stress response protein [Microlunatus capsulatus]|uniref:Alkaline shock family protein YloU n=1 Tax=Microlunatus capsulatus TaxID=99117 RepID=A0ABS4Z9A7_9ACTN|nr:Asp23/Gls24 family envelope stress response protein [Microlunatus capsulatus]MBP2417637.1 putative alkaline shock family protein YloU [Microlunatus capsulatus]